MYYKMVVFSVSETLLLRWARYPSACLSCHPTANPIPELSLITGTAQAGGMIELWAVDDT